MKEVIGKKTIMANKCEQCGHVWLPRNPNERPAICPNPKCKSLRWDKPKRVPANAS